MPDRIPLIGLDAPLLPGTDLGLHILEALSRGVVAHALDNGHTFGVALRRSNGDPYEVGTLARITGYARLPDGRYLLEVEGERRFRVERTFQRRQPMAAVNWITEVIGNLGEAKVSSIEAGRLFHLYRTAGGNGDLPVHLPVDPIARSYLIASLLGVDNQTKQRLLEAPTAVDRLKAELEILRREVFLLDHLRRSTR